MVIFVDTSAIYALLSAGDVNHGAAKAQWLRWVDSSIKFVVTNYILLETSALVQRRLGMRSFRQFHDLLLPTMSVFWISEKIHRQCGADAPGCRSQGTQPGRLHEFRCHERTEHSNGVHIRSPFCTGGIRCCSHTVSLP